MRIKIIKIALIPMLVVIGKIKDFARIQPTQERGFTSV